MCNFMCDTELVRNKTNDFPQTLFGRLAMKYTIVSLLQCRSFWRVLRQHMLNPSSTKPPRRMVSRFTLSHEEHPRTWERY